MLTQDFAIGLLVFIGLVFSLVIHECAHAIVASWCGDDTARLLGRITLNPVPHIDPFMSIVVPAAMLIMSGGRLAFGGAKPVPVNVYRLRHPRRDMMWIALAGPISNVLLAVAFTLVANVVILLRHFDPTLSDALGQVFAFVVATNLLLALFNMLPIPPLDGSRVLSYFLPADLAAMLARAEPFGMLFVAFLVMSRLTSVIQFPVVLGTKWLFQHLIFLN